MSKNHITLNEYLEKKEPSGSSFFGERTNISKAGLSDKMKRDLVDIFKILSEQKRNDEKNNTGDKCILLNSQEHPLIH